MGDAYMIAVSMGALSYSTTHVLLWHFSTCIRLPKNM